ncbi:hypothetical protein GCM10023100_56770 [Actinocorallia cavernae]|uniref:Transposase n=2 Tax=Actinomycetes TaxID=1760 RepID=A0ABP5ZZB8_9ACTN
MLGELIAKFRAHMDEAAANAAVEKYHTAFSDAATVLDGLTPELDEALLSVPTFVAEEARAEAYGARSLNEFKKEHSWQRPESTIPYKYSDLESAQNCTQCNIRSNSAAIDKWLENRPPKPLREEFTVGSVNTGNHAIPVVTGRTTKVANNTLVAPEDA